MYYLLIILSVICFGGCFAINDIYSYYRGSNTKVSLQFSFISSLAGLFVLFIIGGFKFEFTPFTLAMALLNTINGFVFTYCAFKALGTINLSLYSLFSMIGGMLLPFLQGILFYGEAITFAKIICLVFIFAALLLTVEKGSQQKKAVVYYIGIFTLNGMAGVISKIFASSNLPKTSAAGFTQLSCICTVVISLVLLLTVFKNKKTETKETFKSASLSAIGGITNRIANYLLVIALAHVDASVQYPMVTGGVMIVSTLICFFSKRKPNVKEMLSVLLAFLGMLALFVIPV